MVHGHAKNGEQSAEYMCWARMLSRCKDPGDNVFRYYGGRGIAVCDRWLSFANFLSDMGARPSSLYSIERKNTNGGYEPGNCIWATRSEQANNTRSNRKLTAFGKTMGMSMWAREVGMRRETIRERLKTGMEIERALTLPVKNHMRQLEEVL